ncbi:MAG: hypothetical protein ABH828_03470 [archaeon]
MEWLEKRLLLIAAMVIITMMIIGTAFADPAGTGTLTPTSSSRATDPLAGQLNAQGGNVTEIDITASLVTGKWAGFYGDISGSITLESSGGDVFYNWTDASPTGEVFATRNSATPTWDSIGCADITDIATETTHLTLSTGADNITNTFCETCGNHSAFSVSTTDFIADQCTYRSNAFGSAGDQTTNWDQILLDDGNFVLYTTIIDQNTAGFDGNNYDFQLLVAENSSTSVLTNYYFYVEIA